MLNIKLPKGTRDFTNKEIIKRKFLINIIIKNFKLFGFSPLETSSIEKISILKKVYEKENHKMLFNVINSVDLGLKKNALIYDLTVPLVRHIKMNLSKTLLPFKRYQIQKVWRAEKPQNGRFREFYQCDADIIGQKSFWQELEIILLCDKIFKDLKLKIEIKFNSIKILKEVASYLGLEKKFKKFSIILDKYPKINEKQTLSSILKLGCKKEKIKIFKFFFTIKNTFKKNIKSLTKILNIKSISEIKNLKRLYKLSKKINLDSSKLTFSPTLARGINYYSGIIFEIFYKEEKLSLAGGGRYKKLINSFKLNDNLSGIGVSFGLDRIYNILYKKKILKRKTKDRLDTIMFINFGDKEAFYSTKLIKKLITYGISAFLYPKKIKIKKQIKYALKRKLSIVFLLGKKEKKNKILKIKLLANKEEMIFKNIEEFINCSLKFKKIKKKT
ncbi:histidine--tRNA ligase [Candidatus Karelsulcia muelleri]|uniref:histidine--tRNA ligase n=1 Tax=Candidatus Karelsulcia muelleri TaxID=336810 RepID=UPI00236380EE|nr:histidine--tRNA ligase [Candidatus Karelsulcia muelleri]WDE42281.1 histidine--tRNA ligase [Candidatus Karelsulcia muelleri]WDR79130.1 histidine--tRNA ligase [Candidatus Karelsulcia muelleri]